jgi:uncharacterized protein YceK
MVRTVVSALLVTLVFAASGCGSFSDAICGPRGDDYLYYRGVRFDLLAIKDKDTWPWAPLLVLDMPFSAAVDTALAPYIAWQVYQGEIGSGKPPTEGEAKTRLKSFEMPDPPRAARAQ